MKATLAAHVDEAKHAAVEVLLQNAKGPFQGLPRAAAWGYPEPYTRDIMISSLGILVSGNEELIYAVRRTLASLAKHQTRLGHIPSLAHDACDVGASDTTPLFLLGLGLYRKVTGEHNFLADAADKALTWMEYQSPGDEIIVAQLPTSDWRDEHWALGFGLYVNTVVYAYLRLFGFDARARLLKKRMEHFNVREGDTNRYVHEGLVVPAKPYYAFWAYKIYRNERFDLLGNSLAMLTGLADQTRAMSMVNWAEGECKALREQGELGVDLPPNFFPYVRPGDPDWLPRYEEFNQPGEYHNGGVWPFICGFYVAALVAAGAQTTAEVRLAALTDLVRLSREHDVAFGFNEWIRAQDGRPCGQDWQTWSAAMYLYAATCVERGNAIFFDDIEGQGADAPGGSILRAG